MKERRDVGRADYVILGCFFIWLVFGLVMLTSASAVVGFERFGDKYFFIKRQFLFGVLPGLVIFFVTAKVPYHLLKRWAIPISIASVLLLLLVFVPGLGTTRGKGVRNWIEIAGYSLQPAEVAKIGLVGIMAWYLSHLGRRLQDFRQGFLPALAIGIVPVALVLLQPDVGSASILFAILFGMLFVAEANLWHLLALAASGVVGFVLMIAAAPYRAARFTTFLHPELDPLGVGYHINQAFLAIGSGGWFGLGLGHSKQKFEYLPEVHADSIFAVIAEEMGLIIALGLIFLLLVIVYRGCMVAKRADAFGRLLVSGIVIWFFTQSFFNIGAMLGLMPLTGVPLPFVSHGGTALLVAMGAVGLIINVSKQAQS